jgi:hypothetical protein
MSEIIRKENYGNHIIYECDDGEFVVVDPKSNNYQEGFSALGDAQNYIDEITKREEVLKSEIMTRAIEELASEDKKA